MQLLTHCEDHFIHFVVNPQFICLSYIRYVTNARRFGIKRTFSEKTAANSIEEVMKQLLPHYPPGEKKISEVKLLNHFDFDIAYWVNTSPVRKRSLINLEWMLRINGERVVMLKFVL